MQSANSAFFAKYFSCHCLKINKYGSCGSASWHTTKQHLINVHPTNDLLGLIYCGPNIFVSRFSPIKKNALMDQFFLTNFGIRYCNFQQWEIDSSGTTTWPISPKRNFYLKISYTFPQKNYFSTKTFCTCLKKPITCSTQQFLLLTQKNIFYPKTEFLMLV